MKLLSLQAQLWFRRLLGIRDMTASRLQWEIEKLRRDRL